MHILCFYFARQTCKSDIEKGFSPGGTDTIGEGIKTDGDKRLWREKKDREKSTRHGIRKTKQIDKTYIFKLLDT